MPGSGVEIATHILLSRHRDASQPSPFELGSEASAIPEAFPPLAEPAKAVAKLAVEQSLTDETQDFS